MMSDVFAEEYFIIVTFQYLYINEYWYKKIIYLFIKSEC